MAEYTLDNAKRRRGQWLVVDEETEACLQWSASEGWVLTYRLRRTRETVSTLRFHQRQSVQAVSWPGGWPLSKLATLSGDWRDHAPQPRELRGRPFIGHGRIWF